VKTLLREEDGCETWTERVTDVMDGESGELIEKKMVYEIR